MKKLLTILMLSTSLFAQATTANSADDKGPSQARNIVQSAIKALGGNAFLTSTSRSEEGRVYSFYHGQTRGTGVPFSSITRYPDKERYDFIAKRNVYAIGYIPVWVKDNLDVIVIHNGDKGYQVTAQGAVAEEAKDTRNYIRRREHSLDTILRRWINEPGVAYFYDGKAIVDGKTADQVTIMNARNDSVTLYIDDTTHLPLKKSYSWRDPTDKERNTETEVWDNYKGVNGIMTPHSVTRYYNGDMSHQRFLNSVSYDREAPDNLFDPQDAGAAKARGPKKH